MTAENRTDPSPALRAYFLAERLVITRDMRPGRAAFLEGKQVWARRKCGRAPSF